MKQRVGQRVSQRASVRLTDGQAHLRALLARVAERDRAAFAELYDLTSAKLMGVALRICLTRAEAEEVVQVAYVKVWKRASSFEDGRASPVAWMAAIARNGAIDRRRAEAARGGTHDVLEPSGALELADDAPSPEDAAELSSEVGVLHACLGELDPRHAAAVRHAHLDGLAYAEIGARLGAPENTIKTWVRRSLARLRDCMERETDRKGGER